MSKMYSHSRLRTYRQCPRQYQFQYIEHLDIPKLVSADLYVGNVIHRLLETAYRLGADGVLMPKEKIISDYRAEWDKVDIPTLTVSNDNYDVDDYIRIGKKMLLSHYDKYQPFNQGTLLGTEIMLTFDLPDSPFRLQAKIDKLWRRDDGVVEICDYKTGQRLTRPQDPDFKYQMGIYQLAVQNSYPHYNDIELVQFFLRRDEQIPYRMTQNELELLAVDIRNQILTTIDAERLNNFPAKEGRHCDFCSYFEYCPAKRHAKVLQDEENDDHTDAERWQKLAESFIVTNKKSKALKAELDTLKDEIKQVTRETGQTVLEGRTGRVMIRLAQEEGFVTKTKDAKAFAELQHVARSLGLDDFFKLDSGALMKEAYKKGFLSEEQKKKLQPFVHEKENSRVTSKIFKDGEDRD